jgi:hypothetical protein
VDTETVAEYVPDSHYSQRHYLRLGVAVHVRREGRQWTRRKVLHFQHADTFWEWVEERLNPRCPTWIFAHNVGFDLTTLRVWELIERGQLRTADQAQPGDQGAAAGGKKRKPWRGTLVVEDPPTLMRLRSDRGPIVIVDSLNYLRMSLAEIGKSVGLEKLPMPSPSAPWLEWDHYCERDTVILERVMCGLMHKWEEWDCGPWQLTGPQLAHMAWRKTVDPKTVVIDHGEEHTALARHAYYGGECRAFWRGTVPAEVSPDSSPTERWEALEWAGPRGPVYVLDVRSMYPSIMRNRHFPAAFVRMIRNPSPPALESIALTSPVIGECVIESEELPYPVRHEGKTVYAVGRFRTVLAHDELVGAIRRGHVRQLGRVAVYRGAPIFREFVDQWWRRRCEAINSGDNVGDTFCKLILNGSQGKFGQRAAEWIDCPSIQPSEPWGVYRTIHAQTGAETHYRVIAGHTQVKQERGEGRGSFPAIPACITAAGRELMRRYRALCPAGSILYQDTDSLFVTTAGLDALHACGAVGTGELGSLRLVSSHKRACIYGGKDYTLDDEVTVAGLKRSAKQLGERLYEQLGFQRLSEILTKRPDGGVGMDTFQVRLRELRSATAGGGPGWTVPPRLNCDDQLPF